MAHWATDSSFPNPKDPVGVCGCVVCPGSQQQADIPIDRIEEIVTAACLQSGNQGIGQSTAHQREKMDPKVISKKKNILLPIPTTKYLPLRPPWSFRLLAPWVLGFDHPASVGRVLSIVCVFTPVLYPSNPPRRYPQCTPRVVSDGLPHRALKAACSGSSIPWPRVPP